MTLQRDLFKTPTFKTKPNGFVARRSNFSKETYSSPLPENFASIAGEELWQQLNKGCTTNLDLLQVTPNMKCQSFSSEVALGPSLEEGTRIRERWHGLESECYKQQLKTSKGQCSALRRECDLLKADKLSLVQALSMSKQDAELLTAQKEGLLREVNIEKEKMRELKEEIQMFSMAFAGREGMLTSLYTKSRALVENLRTSRVPIPEK